MTDVWLIREHQPTDNESVLLTGAFSYNPDNLYASKRRYSSFPSQSAKLKIQCAYGEFREACGRRH